MVYLFFDFLCLDENHAFDLSDDDVGYRNAFGSHQSSFGYHQSSFDSVQNAFGSVPYQIFVYH